MLDITPKPHNGSLAVSSTLLRNPPFQKRFDWGHPVISSDGDSNAQPSDSQSSLHMQQYEILLSDDAARLRDRPLIASAQVVFVSLAVIVIGSFMITAILRVMWRVKQSNALVNHSAGVWRWVAVQMGYKRKAKYKG
ncbi:unnamed protein product [Cyprideis torosa]|uniref:Uncharacterized protein n=1 Tax=Cyprideis torosa TaxID=163714 RepID=A0A7R8ZU40_9CRUS|nr:unnamed protein product [Cyprideis torosa]CAG0908443.1 unnamed protein product [Cyprideis torosa]